MRGLVLLSALASLAGGAPEAAPDAGQGEEAGPLLAAVQAHYETLQSIGATFEQTSLVASLGREERSSGSVLVQRPGRMRWEYVSPEPSVIVLDGETVQIYSPAEAKLQIAPLDPSTLSPTALGFLLGEADLRETFRAKRLEPTEPAELRLKLVPREEAGFQYLELVLEQGTFRLRGSVLVDLFANRTELRFHDVTENRAIEPDAFRLVVPDDTEVIDLR